MASSIAFTDNIGAAVLTNGKPFPADRFSSWTPISRPFGESAMRQSDGRLTMFKLRDDYGVTFELRGIPSTKSPALLDIADRLCYWLENGGTCSVTTGDADSNVYPTCGLLPGANMRADLKMSDPQMLEYTLSLSLLNLSGTPVRMVCRYSDM